jgi:thioredoxin 1
MRRIVCLIGCTWILAAPACVADSITYEKLSIDAAVKKAAAEKKLVFIDFYADWCTPCKMMDASTFKDPKVVEWLTQHTVALKIDADKNQTLGSQFHIDSFPTFVFLKPDGTEMDRLLGYMTTEQFLEGANGVLTGKDAIVRAREALQKNPSDPGLHLNLASAYLSKQRYAEALAEFLWCLDQNGETTPESANARIPVIMQVLMLIQVYPPAQAEIEKRRDQSRQRLLDGKGTLNDIALLTTVNDASRNSADTLAVYDQIKDKKLPDDTRLFFVFSVMGHLLEAHRYAEIAAAIDIPAEVDQEFKAYGEHVAQLNQGDGAALPDEQRRMMKLQADQIVIFRVSALYQVLIGLGHEAEAAKVADRLVKTVDPTEAYNALAWAGYLTGKPTETNLEQARKANELAKGQNIAVIDTLARILNARGQKKEAIALAREGLNKSVTYQERQMMEACVADLEEQTQTPKR